jgi:beta-N-acetylhexosaminidase
MRQRKTFIIILIFLFITILGVLGLNFGIDFYIRQNSATIDHLNSLRADLDLPAVQVTGGMDITALWTKIKSFRHLTLEIANIPSYESQRQKIFDAFTDTANKYFEQIAAYTQVDTTFIPSSDEISKVDFKVAKDPVGYLASYKQKFRDAVIKYNQTHTPLRFELDVEAELSKMTLQQKLDQMFGFAITGTAMNATELAFLQKYQPGEVVLFGSNVSSNLKTFTDAIQATNPAYLVGIMADEEGGTVKRIPTDPVGSPKDIAKLSTAAACEAYKTRSKVLSDLGINWNLGIVADVTADPKSFIYQRVYGSDYQAVATLVTQAVNCTDSTLTTLKHFPGHGATNVDTHKVVATINLDQKTWETTHLLPFAAGMNANADSVMLGQLKLAALDPDRPATLSSKVVDYIRTQLKYDGILTTDDMVMLETAGYNWQTALEQALTAGNDVLLYSTTGAKRSQILDYALSLVNAGKITSSQIDAHVRRILTAKNKVLPAGFIPSELIY